MEGGRRGICEATLLGRFRPGTELFDSLILHSSLVGGGGCRSCDSIAWAPTVRVLDRGGTWLVAALLHRGVPSCMRCDLSSTFAAITPFMRSGLDEALVTHLAAAQSP